MRKWKNVKNTFEKWLDSEIWQEYLTHSKKWLTRIPVQCWMYTLKIFNRVHKGIYRFTDSIVSRSMTNNKHTINKLETRYSRCSISFVRRWCSAWITATIYDSKNNQAHEIVMHIQTLIYLHCCLSTSSACCWYRWFDLDLTFLVIHTVKVKKERKYCLQRQFFFPLQYTLDKIQCGRVTMMIFH